MSAPQTPPVNSTTNGPYVSYMARRETHSSRALTAVILSVLLLAGLIYLLVEFVLDQLGYDPLLASPSTMLERLAYLPKSVIFPWLAVGGVVASLIGLVLLVKALAPGSLNRHQLDSSRSAIVIDDSVLASAVSARMRQVGNLSEGQVSTAIDRSTVEVFVKPNPGRPVDTEMLSRELNNYISTLHLTPTVRAKLNVERGDS